MVKKISLILMATGVAMIIFSVCVFYNMEKEENKIQNVNQAVLTEMAEQLEEISENSDYIADPYSDKMASLMVDGYEYVGCLHIPDLDLELPVMSQLDEYRLKLAPCLYQGTANNDNMIIGAHNYKKHFANLSDLEYGNSIVFTSMEGIAYSYTVKSIETIMPDQLEQLMNTDYDLTLFTCTYGGRKRTVVRCEKVNQI